MRSCQHGERGSASMMMRRTSMEAEEMSPSNHWMVTLQKVFYPALATVGIPSNMVTFLIIWRRNCMLSRSSSFYLMAMSVADTSVLLSIVLLEFSLKLLQQGEPFWSHEPWCSLRDIFNYGASNASTWLVVVFTGERFVAIHNWRMKSRVCTARCAAWTIAAVFLLSHLLAVPHYWANESVLDVHDNRTRCVYAEGGPYEPFIHGLVWAQTVQAYVLPFAIILLLNRLTLRQISLSNRVQSVRSTTTTRGQQQQHGGGIITPLLRSGKRKSALLLVTVSMTFVLLSVTRAVTQVILRTTEVGRPRRLDRYDYGLQINVAADIGTMLSLSSAAVNMYLYVCTQSRFRRELLACVRHAFHHVTKTKGCCLGHVRLK